MQLRPLGESAWLVYLPDEPAAARLADRVRSAAPPWLEDVVPAYASVGVFFDADRVSLVSVADWIRSVGHALRDVSVTQSVTYENDPVIPIPVYYERGPDLPAVAERLHLTAEAVVAAHVGAVFTVHAIGFVPGFPYMGYLPEALCGVPRLASPRTRVEPGCVGITGRQTGVYPLARPGGWPLIGRTPLLLVDVAEGFFPLRVGDHISFTRIDETEYHRLHGERLGRPVGPVPS